MTNNDTSISEVSNTNNLSHKPNKKHTREYKYKLYTFIIISLLQIFINYDNGVIPVMLNWIQEPYNFSSTELGIMGSLSYFAYVVMSPIMPFILLKFSTQPSITIALVINLLSLVIYALAVNKYMFFVSKFCIGASQSLFTTYYPIWVDTFAPKFHRNLWMSVLQGGIMIGMTLGYVVTSLYSYAGDRGWRYSMLTQIICELILVAMFYLVPKEFINFDPSRDEHVDFDLCTCETSDSKSMEINIDKDICLNNNNDDLFNDKDSSLKRYRSLDFVSNVSSLGMTNKYISRIHSTYECSANKPEYSKCSKCFINNVKLYQETMSVKNLSPWSKFKLLARHNIFILTCIGISALYFEVTGIHLWMTKIGVSHLKVKEKYFHIIFSIEIITGPVIGIITGSYLIDEIIYHYPEHPLFVDIALIIYGLFALLFGIILICVQNPMTFSVCIFIIIFSGASIVPPLTLQSVEYLPHRLKPAGASFFICQYHIFGFTLGSIIPGVAIDISHNHTSALCVIYLSGFVGVASYLLIIIIKRNSIKKQ
ncbi:Major Facilitator Superfamily protein [Theileria parva strain Muguga]|uniref:Major facilitator superfamily (MFS) profile domain-containing protein n=1 Tax=Theileria parva TaxID=5875 RepID=Q4N013_THEPA|nr:Major Facilitator Superfamily protein [Theileria parva strain Muguga]EAN31076.1 Major Facilitator Superfamily protein [Theileria parva strain Muguga]|eukprot:XP_763359.1 hypothetical protein [Theileria parva strain Muguga]